MKTLVKNNKYTQGYFTCKNPSKYRGKHPIIYRSSLELQLFRWVDNSDAIKTWGSESVVIPYQGIDGKIHRYFVDLVCEMNRKDGTLKKYLIEVKPHRQTVPPSITSKKSKKTMMYESYQWALNQAKWDAARKWCETKGYNFLIFTENHLK